MNGKLNALKNMLWALSIVACMIILVGGLLTTFFHRFYGEKESYEVSFSSGASNISDSSEVNVEDKDLKVLNDTADAGDEYISSLTFLCDSSLIGLRDYNIVPSGQVWGTSSGSFPVSSYISGLIKYPNDGSEITASGCAMVSKPGILVIAVGMDGFDTVDETAFKTSYTELINGIRQASPETKIICCSLISIAPDYNGVANLTSAAISESAEWIKEICKNTDSYFADIAKDLDDSSGVLISGYAAVNGKSLNVSGLEKFIEYLRFHALEE